MVTSLLRESGRGRLKRTERLDGRQVQSFLFFLNEQTCVNLYVDNEALIMLVAVGLTSAMEKKKLRARHLAGAIGDRYDPVWTSFVM